MATVFLFAFAAGSFFSCLSSFLVSPLVSLLFSLSTTTEKRKAKEISRLEAAKARKAEALVTKKVVKKEETLTPKILQMKLNHLIAQRGKKGENVRKQITTLRVLSSRVSTTVKPWLLVVGCWLLLVVSSFPPRCLNVSF